MPGRAAPPAPALLAGGAGAARPGDASAHGASPALAGPGRAGRRRAAAGSRAAAGPDLYRRWSRGVGRRQVRDAIAAFLGESVVATAMVHGRAPPPAGARGSDLVRLADQAGTRAVPLVLLLGYLMGLILAFQSSIPLRRFGADIFVVNLVGAVAAARAGPAAGGGDPGRAHRVRLRRRARHHEGERGTRRAADPGHPAR